MNRLQLILSNKHTSGAALAYIGANLLAPLGAIWLPEWKDQFAQTGQLIESAAVGWGLLFAGDARPINGTPKPVNENTPTTPIPPAGN